MAQYIVVITSSAYPTPQQVRRSYQILGSQGCLLINIVLIDSINQSGSRHQEALVSTDGRSFIEIPFNSGRLGRCRICFPSLHAEPFSRLSLLPELGTT